MDYQILFSTIGAIGAAKVLYELPILRRNRLREEYKFAKDFLAEVETNDQLHPYLKEKGYQTIAGNPHLSADEIAYLLLLYQKDHESPLIRYADRALRDYISGRPLLTYRPLGGDVRIVFKEKYASKLARTWRKSLYATLYMTCGILAFSPLILASFSPKILADFWTIFPLCLITFGPYSFLCGKSAERIFRAEHLIDHQHERMARIPPSDVCDV